MELLKVRFGAQAFSMCDVMIKDMQVPRSASHVTLFARSVTHWQDSRRLHAQVSQAGAAALPMSCKVMRMTRCTTHVTFYVQVLSSEFWPKDLLGLVEEGAATLHPTLQQVADAFTEQVSFARVARFSSKSRGFAV